MTPLAQQIAIAKACGKVIPPYIMSEEYVDDPHWNSGFWQTTATFEDGEKVRLSGRVSELGVSSWGGYYAANKFPDYLNDLNAIREATAILPDLASDDNGADQLGYCEWLATVVGAKWGSSNAHDMWLIVNASAAERAEAFLRTIGKWRDDQ